MWCVIFLEMEEVVKAKYLAATLRNNIREPSHCIAKKNCNMFIWLTYIDILSRRISWYDGDLATYLAAMAYLTCGNYSMTGLSCWGVLVYFIQENFCALYLWSCCALRQADNGISHLNVLFLVDISLRSAQGPVPNHFIQLNKMHVLLSVQLDIIV